MRRLYHAWAGIKTSLESEYSFRLHAVAAVFVIIVLAITRPAAVWWALLLLTSGLVLSLEMVNTAIEKLADHLHPDLHPALKTVKDTLAGSVLIASLIAACVFIAFISTLIVL